MGRESSTHTEMGNHRRRRHHIITESTTLKSCLPLNVAFILLCLDLYTTNVLFLTLSHPSQLHISCFPLSHTLFFYVTLKKWKCEIFPAIVTKSRCFGTWLYVNGCHVRTNVWKNLQLSNLKTEAIFSLEIFVSAYQNTSTSAVGLKEIAHTCTK